MSATQVSIQNLTSYQITLDVTTLPLQGDHLTLRAVLPPGQTTTVSLPAGMTADQLAANPNVQSLVANGQIALGSVAPAAGTLLGPFSGYETLRAIQAAAATITHLYVGSAQRPGQLSRIKLISETASIAGETYQVTEIYKNGVAMGVAAAVTGGKAPIKIPALQAAQSALNFDLVAMLGASAALINDGDLISLAITYTNPGGGTMSGVVIELQASH